jgi:hypothetical protein
MVPLTFSFFLSSSPFDLSLERRDILFTFLLVCFYLVAHPVGGGSPTATSATAAMVSVGVGLG